MAARRGGRSSKLQRWVSGPWARDERSVLLCSPPIISYADGDSAASESSTRPSSGCRHFWQFMLILRAASRGGPSSACCGRKETDAPTLDSRPSPSPNFDLARNRSRNGPGSVHHLRLSLNRRRALRTRAGTPRAWHTPTLPTSSSRPLQLQARLLSPSHFPQDHQKLVTWTRRVGLRPGQPLSTIAGRSTPSVRCTQTGTSHVPGRWLRPSTARRAE